MGKVMKTAQTKDNPITECAGDESGATSGIEGI